MNAKSVYILFFTKAITHFRRRDNNPPFIPISLAPSSTTHVVDMAHCDLRSQCAHPTLRVTSPGVSWRRDSRLRLALLRGCFAKAASANPSIFFTPPPASPKCRSFGGGQGASKARAFDWRSSTSVEERAGGLSIRGLLSPPSRGVLRESGWSPLRLGDFQRR